MLWNIQPELEWSCGTGGSQISHPDVFLTSFVVDLVGNREQLGVGGMFDSPCRLAGIVFGDLDEAIFEELFVNLSYAPLLVPGAAINH